MSTVAELISSVEASRRRLLSAVNGLTDEQLAFRPGEGEWSVLEVLEHLYLAEISGVSKIWLAVGRVRAGEAWTDPKPNAGKPIEVVVAATWKPKEVAPAIATPHIGGPVSFWVSATRSLSGILAELGSELDTVRLHDVVFPHYLSGPLDAGQRLEFLRFHIDRHLEQIGRIKSAPSFPAKSR
jgi:hypothetical protein